MKKVLKYTFIAGAVLLFSAVWGTVPDFQSIDKHYFDVVADSGKTDTLHAPAKPDTLPYPFKDRRQDKYSEQYDNSPFYLKDPSNVQTKVEYDPTEKRYDVNENLGNRFYRNPTYLTFDEYVKGQYQRISNDYWRKRSNENSILSKKPLIPKIYVGGEVFDRIFGGNTVDIRPQGSAELTFGWSIRRNENPIIPEKQRQVSNFDFKQKIQMNVIANIGDKLRLSTNYNTEATFDFENQMKLEYTGYEDEIIKKIEAGNVNLPLNNSLISGSQSLFGIKTQLQFGRLTVTSIFSQQKGKTSTIETAGGAQTTNFNISADQYEANKHYFLSQYFKDRFDSAVAKLPIIRSSVQINKVEVWVTNKNKTTTDTRNFYAFMDLAEDTSRTYRKNDFNLGLNRDPFPDNNSNTLYASLTEPGSNADRDFSNSNSAIAGYTDFRLSTDYERVESARKLAPNEFTFNAKLGYVSLVQPLNNDEVLAVAYEYKVGDKLYKVGELSTAGIDAPKALYLKLLKSKTINTQTPIWQLMMKNIYNIGGYQINSANFKLDVLYMDNSIGSNINYIPEGKIAKQPLIRVLNMDQLDIQQNPKPDGYFDFIDGVTISAANGRVMFPCREPFGNYLRRKFADPQLANKYCFDTLYKSPQSTAKLVLTQNKFSLKGTFQSASSSEISLNALNVPQGSVIVTAGGTRLTEGVDFTVEYAIGRVRIINEGVLLSGQPLKITTESNSLFSIQTKRLMGSRFDYRVNKNFNLGATVLNLTERPLTKKVNVNDEPISNTIMGFDLTYTTQSRFLTKLVDNIPFINTKEPSSITVAAEYAQLFPGHSSTIGASGTSYIDDFEGSKTPLQLNSPYSWYIASTPQGQPTLFPEAQLKNNLRFGFNRARLAWYNIDGSIFYRDNSSKPPNITDNDLSDDNVREVLETELFPNKQPSNGQVSILPMFNMAYYPTERGPYNYDVNGLSADGRLKNPQTRWAGISRRVEPTDFDASNVEFIEFWIMDPFRDGSNNKGGQLYFNLGNVSEDVLHDELKSFENGLLTDDTTNNSLKRTAWGRIPNNVQSVVTAFDNNRRDKQDVGLDGLGDNNERTFFKQAYLDQVQTLYGTASKAYQNAYEDPSGDNFHCSKGADYDNNNASILQRYRKWNGAEGNSVNSGACIYGSTPDNEDINGDNGLDILEAYYQYKVDLAPSKMNVGENYITAMVQPSVKLKNGSTEQIRYYQFKIPVRKPEQVIGGISDFKSIRFIRMFMRGFQDSVILRFAKLQLVRSEWRKYNSSLLAPGEYTGDNDNFDKTSFDVTTINLEEDGTRSGIPYVLPPGIDRELAIGTATQQRLNEQSLLLRACNLQDGDSRSSFKNVQLDVRNYKKIKMYVHAEKMGDMPLNNGDVSCFVRLGSDFNDNYYEYELPLTISAIGSRSQSAIWPDENMMEISLETLQEVKQRRNNDNWPLNKPYPAVMDGKGKISVKGVPNLSGIRTIMIGIRNPKQQLSDTKDDGLAKCVEMWVNELRLSDFDEKGGWAANARINAKLADFATINLSGSRITPGFGGIEQKLNDRKKDDLTQYDVSSSVELGKFLPEKSGVRVPMFVGYSEAVSVPQYNPLDPDVKLQSALDNLQDEKKRQELKEQTVDFTKRRSINFTNVKKNKVNVMAKSHFYDVENLNLTYAYTEAFRHNINIEGNLAKTYRAALGYNFATTPINIQPFAKLSSLSKYLQPIADFNFYFSPSSISFRTDVDRQFTVNKQRNVTGGTTDNAEATYYKIFNVNRFYDVKFDLTKSLKLDFNAVNNGVVDEPIGAIDTKSKEDSIRKNFFPGRTTKYHQTINVNWNVPINKLPLLDFTSLTIKHTIDYDWTTGTGQRRPDGHFLYGNTISNATSTNANLNLTMGTLYSKIPYFQRIMQGGAPPAPKNFLGGKLDKSLNTLKTDTAKAKKKEEKPPHDPDLYVFLTRLLLSVKTIGGTYTLTQGTLLSGYDRTTQFLGQNQEKSPNGNTIYEPGWDFLLGRQYLVGDKVNNIRYVAARNGWLVKDTTLNNPFIQTNVQNYTLKANMEPLSGFRIDFNANRNYSLNHQEFFRFDNRQNEFTTQNAVETGNLSLSFFSLQTIFDVENNEHISPLFEKLRAYRYEISRRASSIDERSSHQKNLKDSIPANRGFFDGYGGTSQDVLIPAFIAAYSGKSQTNVKLNPFAMLPAPNWRITYDGLSKLKFVQKYFRSITLGNAYRSSLSISSFSSNSDYHPDTLGRPNSNNRNPNNGNLYPKYDIAQVNISEQLSPLISVDMAWKNSLTSRAELRRDRTVGLSMANNQVTETIGYEYIIGAGYKIKQFKIPFRINGAEVALKNDLDLKVDIGIRQTNTTIRKIEENTNIPSAGQQTISIKVTADYVVNERFNIRAFYYRDATIPIVSSAYPTTNTNIGVSIRFSLSQ